MPASKPRVLPSFSLRREKSVEVWTLPILKTPAFLTAVAQVLAAMASSSALGPLSTSLSNALASSVVEALVSSELLEEAAEPLSASALVSEQPARPRPATVAKVAATKPRRSRTTCWERFLLMGEHLSQKILVVE